MKITDAISITELSRLMQKSRPTIYKYIEDYEWGDRDAVPALVKELFRRIEEEDLARDDIIAYCKMRFGAGEGEWLPEARRFLELLKMYQHRVDFDELEKSLRKAIHER